MKEKRPLTREEEADEIVKRLSAPPKPRWPYDTDIENVIAMLLAKNMAIELDDQLLTEIKTYSNDERNRT